MPNWSGAAGIVLAVALGCGAASTAGQAQSILAATTRNAFLSSASKAPVPVPLNDAGGGALSFSTAKPNQPVRIVYNTECGATGAGGWVSVAIYVDGVPAAPSSGTGFALCTARDATQQIWSSATRESRLTLPAAGTHIITMTAQGVGKVTSWLIGNGSLVVD